MTQAGARTFSKPDFWCLDVHRSMIKASDPFRVFCLCK
jgi:hypothetical protein